MKNANLIFFDLDNTLIDPDYITFVWEIAVPQLYARKYNVSFSEAGKILGLRILDHIIVTKKGYFSFQEAGLIS